MSNSFWSEVVKASVSLLVLLLSTGLPFVWKWINQHFSLKQVGIMQSLAQVAANAVEQMAGVEGWTSEQKYKMAVHFLDDLANAHHITLDESQFKPLIEAAVRYTDSYVSKPISSVEGNTISNVLSSEPALSIEQLVEEKIGAALQKVVWHPEVAPKVVIATS